MLVCPQYDCRAVQDEEGASECFACHASLEPTAKFARRREAVAGPVEVRPMLRHSRWWTVVEGVIVVYIAAALVIAGASLSPSDSAAQTRIDRLAEDVARSYDSGALDTGAAGRLESDAQVESGCGHVHVYIVPAPPEGQAGMGGIGQQQPDPRQGFTSKFRPDVLSVAEASAGRQLVYAAAWACQ